jgi:hypothetical protein
MSDFQPTAKQLEALIRAGHQAFLKALSRESIASARRLAVAYKSTLEGLDAQIRALSATGLDSGAVRNLYERVRDSLNYLTGQIGREARRMEVSGLAAGRDYASLAIRAAGVTVGWNEVGVEQIRALIRYVDSPAFGALLDDYGQTHAQRALDIILSLESQGWGPEAVAQRVRQYLTKMPYYDSVRLTRTVQIYGARMGTREQYLANPDIVLGWIWSSARDTHTCPSCWSMDGKRFPISVVLNDHHSGKCVPIPITPSWAELGVPGGQDLPELPSGESLFRGLTEQEQQQILGKARWTAWQDGAFSFDQLSEIYQNPVYGEMRRERSLDSLIGRDAAAAYGRAATIAPTNGG